MAPYTTVTIEAPLHSKEPVSDEGIDAEVVTTSQIERDAGTYKLNAKTEDTETAIQWVRNAANARGREFEYLIPEELKEQYTVLFHNSVIWVQSDWKTIIAAAHREVFDERRNRTPFRVLRKWESSNGGNRTHSADVHLDQSQIQTAVDVFVKSEGMDVEDDEGWELETAISRVEEYPW